MERQYICMLDLFLKLNNHILLNQKASLVRSEDTLTGKTCSIWVSDRNPELNKYVTHQKVVATDPFAKADPIIELH